MSKMMQRHRSYCEIDYKPITACFSGYRTKKLIKGHPRKSDFIAALKELLREKILELYRGGYCRFICGMGEGFDLIAASVLLEIRESKPLIELIAAIPFIGHYQNYSDDEKELYNQILLNANKVEVIYNNPDNQSDAHLMRNRYMLESSSTVVCYFNPNSKEPRSGTQYNVRHALSLGLEVVNLFSAL